MQTYLSVSQHHSMRQRKELRTHDSLAVVDPVASARAVVATGVWVKSKHDVYLIRGSVEA